MLELLVTLVVLGLLLVTLTQGIRVGLRAWAIEGHLSLRASGLDTTDRTVRQLLERVSPGEPRSRNGTIIGTAHTLSFTTTLPQGYGAPMTHEADVTLLVTERHQLALLWRPHYRRWIAPLPAAAANLLVDDVDRLDLEFWQAARTPQQPGRWLSAWSAREPPLLVRLRIVFPPGDVRRWPDIVIAPKQAAVVSGLAGWGRSGTATAALPAGARPQGWRTFAQLRGRCANCGVLHGTRMG